MMSFLINRDGTCAHIFLPSLLNNYSPPDIVCGDTSMHQLSTGAVVLFLIAFATLGGGLRFAASAQPQAQQQVAPAGPTAGTYILGPNDRVRVKVYGEPDITGEYEVDSTGQISVPLAATSTRTASRQSSLSNRLYRRWPKASCVILA